MNPAPAEARRIAATTSDVGLLISMAGSEDLATLCLVAVNPATPPAIVSSLAAHSAPCVRRAVATRQGLDAGLALELARDPSVTVRRAAQRRQLFGLDALIDLMRSGISTPRIHEQLRRLVIDPAATRRLLEDPALVFFAAGGAIDRRTFREVFRDLPPWTRSFLAGRCRFESRDLVRLSRDAERSLQEVVARRSDLDAREREALLRRGGVWAVAALVEADPDGALPWRVRFRRHRVVRRSVVARETNRLLLWWWSRSAPWDVACRIGSNPHIGRRTIRRLSAPNQPWSVQEALARRADVADFARRLGAAPPVLLALAANPAAPAWMIDRLSQCSDPYVRGQAIGHPAASIELARAVLSDPSASAWEVRRAAEHPGLDDVERDAALAWVALGGGSGDPTFDPVTCHGNPDTALSANAAYEAEARRQGRTSPLWRGRESWTHLHHRLGHPDLVALASDSHCAVRRRAASFGWRSLLEVLQFDADPAVAATARQTLAAPDVPRPPHRRPDWLILLGRAAPLVLVGTVGILASRRESPDLSPGSNRVHDTASIEILPDTLDRTSLMSYDDACVIGDVVLAVGKDAEGEVGIAVTAGPDEQILAGFGLSDDDRLRAAVRADPGQTVTVVVPSAPVHVSLVRHRSGPTPRVSDVTIASGSIVSEDCM